MNGWMFFPSGKEDRFSGRDVNAVLSDLLETPYSLSPEEWKTYIPESRERRQGSSLGFFCGDGGLAALKNSPAAQDMPEFPMPVLVSDFAIQPSCWTFKEQLSVLPVPDREYLIRLPVNFNKVITVTGTLANRPPYVAVYGSYCFFPPPYILAERPPN